MDRVLYSARANKTRNHKPQIAVKKRDAVLCVESAEYVADHKLRLKFNNKRIRIVDFAPFLQQSANPLIRRYLDLELFKSFSLSNGDLEWNDYDLVFPIADLYANDLLKKKEAVEPKVRRRNSRSKPRVTKELPKARTRAKAQQL